MASSRWSDFRRAAKLFPIVRAETTLDWLCSRLDGEWDAAAETEVTGQAKVSTFVGWPSLDCTSWTRRERLAMLVHKRQLLAASTPKKVS